MGLSITDAIAVHNVLHRLAPRAFDNDHGMPRIGDDQVLDAAARLADAAHDKLGVGPTADDVRKAWGKR